MSGASGKVPAVIHLSPEALLQGPIGKVRSGDMLVIDAEAGVLDVEIEAAEWAARPNAEPKHQAENEVGFGRELFGVFRAAAAPAEQGASVFGKMVGEHADLHPDQHAPHRGTAPKAHTDKHTSTIQAS
jgi:phosphogluconate dehydratase